MHLQQYGVPERGRQLAANLAGSWRISEPLCHSLEELTLPGVARLLDTGTAALVWRRLGGAGLRRSPSTRRLRDAYRQTVLDNACNEHHVAMVFGELRAAGIEPLLVKGWSVARLYPEPGLRPCGDIDLCVRPDQLPSAKNALAGIDPSANIDLHAGIADLDDRTWEQVWQRTRLVSLGNTYIRILGAEDQLRHLCLHLMRHGAFRPLWLCDVAVAVETRPPDFDWNYCLSGNRRLTEWVLCTLGLAQRLLDARLVEPPSMPKSLPHWLEETVLCEWGSKSTGDSHMRDTTSLVAHLRRPVGLLRAVRSRWPNPIEAAFKMGASPWTRLPVFWFQLGYLARRALGLPAKIHRCRLPSGLPFDIHQDEAWRPAA